MILSTRRMRVNPGSNPGVCTTRLLAGEKSELINRRGKCHAYVSGANHSINLDRLTAMKGNVPCAQKAKSFNTNSGQ